MKIVIFGLTISSSWGNGHATLWRGMCRALDQKRHSVTFYEHDTPYYAATRDCWEIRGGTMIGMKRDDAPQAMWPTPKS